MYLFKNNILYIFVCQSDVTENIGIKLPTFHTDGPCMSVKHLLIYKYLTIRFVPKNVFSKKLCL